MKDPQFARMFTFTRSPIAQSLSIYGLRKIYVSSLKGFVFKLNTPGVEQGLYRVMTQVIMIVFSPLIPVI